MKIRKISLVIASAIVMTGSTAAVAPACEVWDSQTWDSEEWNSGAWDSQTWETIPLENFFPRWKEEFDRCVLVYGENQRDLCGRYVTLDMNYKIHIQRKDLKKAAYFKGLAEEVAVKLFDTKYPGKKN
ncbi:hypothetical protein ACFLIN_10660 [Corynebacterium kutscheri]|uniref:Uncharacterized protein n=1 Tax=Corynebacterium kutscheri TaxID=35755 RepID=A0A0F6QZ10_9CORY|nr:hypothetical protein [Corynebacterium kutscheri]AKE40867.1 hypothetical protein UL82_03275 [Corynebacterium kutscheri]VEH06617.1 Uncharacterised protein [Corynebacterium kutscheri]VEH09164.1 Uncharacterised protein [Corynebacterium kutscheri]